MNHPKYGLAPMLALLAAQPLGCAGSSAPGPSPEPGSVSLQELPGRLVHAICDNIAACCEASGIYVDAATCQLNATAYVGQLLVDSRSPSIRYDSGIGARCLAAYEGLLEACSPMARTWPRACDGLFTGILPVGTACSTSHECAKPSAGESAYCASNSGDTEGTICTAHIIAHAQLGDACVGTCDTADRCTASAPWNQICFYEDSLQCDPLVHVCRTLGAIGEECGGPDGICASDAFCNDRYLCEARRDSGSCLNAVCSATSYCERTSLQCTPKQANGAACKSAEECSGGLCSSLHGCGMKVDVLATDQSCTGAL